MDDGHGREIQKLLVPKEDWNEHTPINQHFSHKCTYPWVQSTGTIWSATATIKPQHLSFPGRFRVVFQVLTLPSMPVPVPLRGLLLGRCSRKRSAAWRSVTCPPCPGHWPGECLRWRNVSRRCARSSVRATCTRASRVPRPGAAESWQIGRRFEV